MYTHVMRLMVCTVCIRVHMHRVSMRDPHTHAYMTMLYVIVYMSLCNMYMYAYTCAHAQGIHARIHILMPTCLSTYSCFHIFL